MDAKLLTKLIEESGEEITKPRILTMPYKNRLIEYLKEQNGDMSKLSLQEVLDISFDPDIQKFINDNWPRHRCKETLMESDTFKDFVNKV